MAEYVAIIADGNRRWARGRELAVQDGHEAAADTLAARVRDAASLGVKELTVYVFSTENWSRPETEIDGLMEMLCRRLQSETVSLHHDDVRMRFLGDREDLSAALREQMDSSEAVTQGNSGLTLYVALNYGGRDEIVRAARRFDGSTHEEFARCLHAPDMHDPEVIIRTGGERRLSNFLLWRSAYAELVFRDELWPNFTRQAFEQCLREFDRRTRRFGGR
ncbi:MAG TPA: polyprenyl diphosphate synthase [Solirubrobacteraceae bacterium]|jgi:undecaprenyl diphosphate synthase|nr:polyprenyl diphosphate synthase [Solirubrobacteraceae bacterium]